MKKVIEDDELPDEIDFSNAVRGKYPARVENGSKMILLEPDITKVFQIQSQ